MQSATSRSKLWSTSVDLRPADGRHRGEPHEISHQHCHQPTLVGRRHQVPPTWTELALSGTGRHAGQVMGEVTARLPCSPTPRPAPAMRLRDRD
jgi:hypothetical protein